MKNLSLELFRTRFHDHVISGVENTFNQSLFALIIFFGFLTTVFVMYFNLFQSEIFKVTSCDDFQSS